MCTQILGGRLTEKFGAKWICGIGIFLPSIFNAMIPFCAEVDVSLVIIMRILMGIFHGWVYSSLFSMFAKWFPKEEQTFALAGTTFGGNFGGVITMPLAGYLCKIDFLEGWPTVFYLTSIIHIIWFALWCRYVYSSPEEDPRITESELRYISRSTSNSKPKDKVSIPWKALFTSKPVYASIVTKFTGAFGYYLLCTKMPKYLDHVFGMAIHTNSWFNSLMYLILCISLIIGGPLSTYIKNKGWIKSQTRIRKNFQSFGKNLKI
jgi:ACS family sodium-dependent inorganic phosphate cotransporter-like MFS transporter 5